MTTLILVYYNPKLETWIETNSFNFVMAYVQLQMHNKVLRPVAYFSKKLIPAEYNYIICSKKLFVIIKNFEMWHLELASAIN